MLRLGKYIPLAPRDGCAHVLLPAALFLQSFHCCEKRFSITKRFTSSEQGCVWSLLIYSLNLQSQFQLAGTGKTEELFMAALWAGDEHALCQPCAGFPTGFFFVCLNLRCGFMGRLRGCPQLQPAVLPVPNTGGTAQMAAIFCSYISLAPGRARFQKQKIQIRAAFLLLS